MDESDDDITRLEARIEELGASIERCRKISVAAKIAIGVGAAWLVASLLWIVPFAPPTVIAALAAVIGGIVLAGSNASTWAQAQTTLDGAERLRADLIDRTMLCTVGEEWPTVH